MLNLFAGAYKYPNNPAIITANLSINYKQFLFSISESAEYINTLGIKKGSRVAILSDYSIEYAILLFALFTLGIIAVPLSTRLPFIRISKIVKELNCSILVLSGPLFKNEINNRHSSININEIVRKFTSTANEKTLAEIKIPANQDATIILSSGSSGSPKYILHTIANHYYSALGSNNNIVFSSDDKWLLSLPIYHVGGLSTFFKAIISGGAVIIPKKEASLEENLKHYPFTHISMVLTQIHRLLKNKSMLNILSEKKAILIGGSPIPLSIKKELQQNNLPIFCTYGSTEMASQIATTPPGNKNFSSGKCLKYREIKIAHDGEILVKGKTLFKGYIKENKIVLPITEDKYFATGDIGYIDEEGYLYIKGRKDNMFISGGENIYPEEIEKYICCIDEIINCIVVPVPDRKYGYRPVAFIKYKHEQLLKSAQIQDYLKKYLPGFMLPDLYFNWPEENNSTSLKVDRNDFKKKAINIIKK